ncbi:ChaN family lipoprotein [Phaeovibrio sulfidiphilus]|uniref:ChaN family lipoprotein n=1 Tax=Phaeovibrio sulfidiphilus TaxID=1220600 RepID=A0A8J6YWA2_9PROT|nr:ChaN family lipoprotein [Phaeovibrio sulfidiphilus]MBE1236867.1 ChaN family lipoprotein [Phaeovibrio sulfidiphilus]
MGRFFTAVLPVLALMAGCSGGAALHLPDVAAPAATPSQTPGGPLSGASTPADPVSPAPVSPAPGTPPAGTLEDRRSDAPLGSAALFARILDSDVVVLGERHDNPWHRQFQTAVVDALVRAGRRPALVVEMLDGADVPALSSWRAAPDRPPEALAASLDWEKTGRGPFAPLADVFRLARDHGLEIRPGSPSRERLRQVVREGVDSLPTETVSALGLDRPMPRFLENALRQELEAAHCGHMPAVMIPGMVNAQRLRDGALAHEALQALQADPGARPVVILTGLGHARTDRGAPWILSSLAPSLRVLSVGLLEVSSQSPGGAAEEETGARPWDVMWFAPAPQRPDPCAAFGLPSGSGSGSGGSAPSGVPSDGARGSKGSQSPRGS